MKYWHLLLFAGLYLVVQLWIFPLLGIPSCIVCPPQQGTAAMAADTSHDGATQISGKQLADLLATPEKPLLVDFWAPWCGPCRKLGPVIDDLAREYKDRVIVAKINVDDNRDTAQKYGIRGIPTIILFKDGKVDSQLVGLQSKASLKRALDAVVAQPSGDVQP